eukprot:5481582-Pleurochrysis_carterae.AAC.1
MGGSAGRGDLEQKPRRGEGGKDGRSQPLPEGWREAQAEGGPPRPPSMTNGVYISGSAASCGLLDIASGTHRRETERAAPESGTLQAARRP